MTYCCNQDIANASCCDTNVSGNLIVKVPVASMIPVTTSFSGSIYTTALPTLLSSTAPKSNTGGSSSPSPSSPSFSMPQTSKRLSVGAGVGIGIAATSGVVFLALVLGCILLRHVRRNRTISHNATNGDHGVSGPFSGEELGNGLTAEIDSSMRHELL